MRVFNFFARAKGHDPGTSYTYIFSGGLLLSALILLQACPVLADSDGYYCTGRGYLAYQFNGSAASSEGQTLYLQKLDPEKGISEPRQIRLEPFQVQGMRCLDEMVDLLAWDRIYRIDLNDEKSPRIGKVEPQPEDSIFPDFTSENLGRWAFAPNIIPLKTRGGRFSFELVIEPSTDPATDNGRQGIRHHVRSFVRQKDAGGAVLEWQIFSGNHEETAD